MRTGLGVSVAAHAAVLAYGLFALPHATPLEVEATEAMPVELVDVAEVTDLKKGDKDAKIAPADVPRPAPVVKAPEPAPDPVPTPAPTPVEATAPPPPPPPEPKPPEPKPEPQPQEAAVVPVPEPPPPPEPKPEPAVTPPPEADTAAQTPAPKPRARPTPPKAVAQQPKPDAKQDASKLAQLTATKTETFDSTKIAALLNNQKPAGGGDPNPSQQPQTVGSVDGKSDAAMTQSWMAALVAKLRDCWILPNGVQDAQNLRVVIAFNLQPDGSLEGEPQILEVDGVSNPSTQVAAENARRAVAQCAPYNDIFPPEHYDIWHNIQVNFDPRLMFGAG